MPQNTFKILQGVGYDVRCFWLKHEILYGFQHSLVSYQCHDLGLVGFPIFILSSFGETG